MRPTIGPMILVIGMITPARQYAMAQTQSSRGAIILPTQGEQIRMGTAPVPVLIKVDSATTGSRKLFVFQVPISPGDSLPLHRHHRDDELIFVHEGEVQALVGDRQQRAAAGTLLFIPAGVPVSVSSTGKRTAKLLIVFDSQHMAEYIRSLGTRLGAPPRVLSTAERDSIAARHHITFP